MALTDYTTYQEVRAALGVSDDEIDDTTLALPLFDSNLRGEFRDISVSIPTTFATVSLLSPSSRTDAQQWFYDSTRIFATYAVAKQLTVSLPMFGPKDIGDGKAVVSRFADSPYKETIKAINQEYERFRTRLSQALAALQSTSAPSSRRSYLSSVSPSSDPVTGT